MLTKTFRCSSLLLILGLRMARATPVSSSTPSEESERQAKAAEILRYMNASADPCEDFYEFTCGNYAKLNPASRDSVTTGFLQTLLSEVRLKIKSILSANFDAKDAETEDENVKRFFQSCMKLQSEANSYPDKLRDIINEFGQMPALVGETWREDNFDWMQTLAKIAHNYAINIFIDFQFDTDFVNKSEHRLYVQQPAFELPRPLYREEEFLRKRQSIHKWRLAEFLGLETPVALQTASDITKLERFLTKAITDKQAGYKLNEVFTLRTIDEVQRLYYPDLDFKKLIQSILGSIPNLAVYTQDAYMENLIEVLRATPQKTLANYMFYKLSTAFMLRSWQKEEQQQDACLTRTEMYFHKNLYNMVYRQYYTAQGEHRVQQMWSTIKASFQNRLDTHPLNWIREETRKSAAEKLRAMKLDIISFQVSTGGDQLNSLSNQDYIGNLKTILSSKAAQKRASIANSTPELDHIEDFWSTPSYVFSENAIKLPVALVQPQHAWSSSFPNAFNFGVLGSLLSHELLHGYDIDGRTYDAQGNHRQWWDEDSDNAFNIRSKCFSDQYHEYKYSGRHLPAMANQDENIADNGAVRLAYAAYLAWYENAVATQTQNMQPEYFHGLNYSHQQLFFISYGHLFCSDIYSKYKTALLAFVHVPTKFRVIGSLSNFEEFSKQFNCSKDSAMNPSKKCEIY